MFVDEFEEVSAYISFDGFTVWGVEPNYVSSSCSSVGALRGMYFK